MQEKGRELQGWDARRRLRIGLLGMGVIGSVHAAVLATLDDVDLLFTADPEPTRRSAGGVDVPHFASLESAVRAGAQVDLIVVATPTPSHLELVSAALHTTSAMVLSEKPLTGDLERLTAFERGHASDLDRVRIVNHFAFAPEVEWAVEVVRQEGWGVPADVLSTFNDPYISKTASERQTYVSSWVDSGSNQLSMLARFAAGFDVVAHRTDTTDTRSATTVRFEGGTATLVTNWYTGDSSKQTRLRWRGDRELFLDHTAMTGYQLEGGSLTEHFAHDWSVTRKVAHYRAMYRALLADPTSHSFSLQLARSVAGQLTAATTARSTTGVRWKCAAGAAPDPTHRSA